MSVCREDMMALQMTSNECFPWAAPLGGETWKFAVAVSHSVKGSNPALTIHALKTCLNVQLAEKIN